MMLRLLVIELVAIAMALTIALDMYAHKRVEALGGVNYWGYRGPVANQRKTNEIRVAVVGGTRAFGWGASASALVSEVRRQILLTTDQRGKGLRPVVVISLGRPGALPESYPAIIEHFAYLKPDYICLYDDLGVRGATPGEGTSGVFEMTGYAPALPLVLREKGLVWRYGDVERGYSRLEGSEREHQPSAISRDIAVPLWRRAAGSTLASVAGTMGAADHAIARVQRFVNRDASARERSAAPYDQAMMTAVEAAHRHARGVVVVVSPSETAEQVANLRALETRMHTGLEPAPWFRFVDLGSEAELSDPALRIDGWNYASAGIALVAGRIAPALLSLIGVP
jgi:hypothetical protein